jgi:hypothetical protein
VSAQAGTQILGAAQRDLDGDGQPDLTIIDCTFASGQDKVYVYDQLGNMGRGADPHAVTDFYDDVWVFDVGGDGSAELIIDFSTSDGQSEALLYDDVDGDGAVSYRVDGKQVAITESDHWHVRVAGDGDWLLPDGSVNPSLVFDIDGYLLRYLEWGEAAIIAEWVEEQLVTDGTVEWRLEIVDQDGDGAADYQLLRFLPLEPAYAPIFRSTLYVSVSGQRPAPQADAVFWPLLVGKHDYESYNYFDRPPAIAMDWQLAKIDRVGVFGYPTEQGYHVNSRTMWAKGQTNYADFENPMAYYDVAGDQDGRPELFVRLEVFEPLDPFLRVGYRVGGFPDPMVQVDYSWDQDNDGKWDYKVDLGGRHAVTATASFADFAIRTLPYSEVPSWVVEREWDAALLVAAEEEAYWSSEGIAEWNMNRGYRDGRHVEPSKLRSLYLTGITDERPVDDYAEIREGMRGEYSFEYAGRPQLYISAIDGRLHLWGAEAGVWNLGGESEIRYANLDGDAYLDEWRYVEDSVVRKQLNHVHNYLVYAGEQKVVVKEIGVPAALFSTAPPRDHGDWVRLGQELEQRQPQFEPDDFEAMVGRFAGEPIIIEGASISTFRRTESGFRSALELAPSFFARSDPPHALAPVAEPGAYLFANEGGHISVRPLEPVALRASDLQVGEVGEAIRQNAWTLLSCTVRNEGLEDASDVLLCASLSDPGGRTEVLTNTLDLVPGEGTRQVSWDWLPSREGSWELKIMTGCTERLGEGDPPQVLGSMGFDVGPSPAPSLSWLITLGGRVPRAVILLLASLVTVAASGGGLWVLGLEEDPPAEMGDR